MLPIAAVREFYLLINKIENHQLFSGYFFAISATAIWSGNFIIARGLNESIPPISLAFWRWVVAVIVFLPFALKPLIADWQVIKKNIPYLCLTSLLGITIFNTLIYFAGHTTTALNLSLISVTFPIFIVILSRIFFNEAITVNKSVGITLVASGVVLLVTKGALFSLLNISLAIGDVWMLLAAVTFAVYSILLKHKPAQIGIMAFQLSTFLLGLIFLFPFYLWEYLTAPHVVFAMKTVCSILYVGVFASLTAFVLWNKAVVALGPSKAGLVYYTLPVFSGISAYFYLNEEISIIHFYSVLLIVSGILTASYESKRSRQCLPAAGGAEGGAARTSSADA
ncbi:DMT family transporter [Oryzomonas japonica]|uniref:DMT family transporter n=1 Tax=Oryzomonas japonica TaxID=2603858 RepID=UPI001C3F7531|nr:DMT family transporter [Oryzomonas japonica]